MLAEDGQHDGLGKNPHRFYADGGKRKKLLAERIVTQLLMAKHLQPFLKIIWLSTSPTWPFLQFLSAPALVVRLTL